MLKTLYWPLFSLMGVLFLLVSTLFWLPITRFLLDFEQQANLVSPPFWDLTFVLTFVRAIFIFVGIFLLAFGFLVLWLKQRG